MPNPSQTFEWNGTEAAGPVRNILILSSSEGMALMLLRSLKTRARRLHVYSIWHPSGFSVRSRYCASHSGHRLDSCDAVAIADTLDRIREFIGVRGIEGVIPAGMWATFFLTIHGADLSPAWVFPLPTPDQFRRLHDKSGFVELARGLGVPTPATLGIDPAGQPVEPAWGYPVIIKPVIGGNSEGVSLCRSRGELDAYLEREADGRKRFQVQEFIHGREGVFGFVAYQGQIQAWTLHVKERDVLHFLPDARVVEMARRLIADIRYTGPGNFDLLYEEGTDRIAFLECNPRVWASFGASCSYGVDFFEIGRLLAQGQTPGPELPNRVTAPEDIPYPGTRRFLAGCLTGRYRGMDRNKTAYAWRTLWDPVPALRERVDRIINGPEEDDTPMIDRLTHFLPIPS